MTVWYWIARHGAGVQRLTDWTRLLGGTIAEFEPFLVAVPNPAGIRFWAQLGGGEEEYEVFAEGEGYVAVPVDGGAARPLNPTEAEFRRVDLDALVVAIASSGGIAGTPIRLDWTASGYRLGDVVKDGRPVTVFLAPRANDIVDPRFSSLFSPIAKSGAVALILVPSLADVDMHALAGRQLAVGQLPVSPPWAIEYGALADTPSLGFVVANPGEFFGRQYVLIVHKKQQKAWIEGHPLHLHAGVRPYLFLEYLADRPNLPVPHSDLVEGPLEHSSYGTPGKMVGDAKHEVLQAIEKALDGVTDARITARNFIKNERGRERLNLPASLVRVIG